MVSFHQEIRFHGRGGQGSVAAAALLSMAAFNDGYEAQAIPRFGPERRGAPVEACVRISSEKIRNHFQVYQPNILIVQDASLLHQKEIFHGLSENSLVLLNCKNLPASLDKFRFIQLDATQIGKNNLGLPLANVPLLGAFSAILQWPSLAALEKAIQTLWKSKGDKLIQANIQSLHDGFDAVEVKNETSG